MCFIPNGFQDRNILLYNSKIVDKEDILRTVSNTGIYCSRDKVRTVYPVQYIFKNSTVNISALCNSCEDMACCSSECISAFHYAGDDIHSCVSEPVRNRTHVHRGELPYLDRLLDWTAVCLEKERYSQCHGWLHWFRE
jgi:hypothetical protein